jgi:ABC-type histidine transport system ATPase subunit
MSTNAPLLAIEGLHAAYGLSRVLFGISLQVEAGECVCPSRTAWSSSCRRRCGP